LRRRVKVCERLLTARGSFRYNPARLVCAGSGAGPERAGAGLDRKLRAEIRLLACQRVKP